MYKEITVYTTDKLSRNQQWVQLFTCRGVACDEAWPPHRRGNVCEERVLYNGMLASVIPACGLPPGIFLRKKHAKEEPG